MSAQPQPSVRSGLAGRVSPRLVAGLLFLLALAPRLPGLDRFLTTDETYFFVAAGSDVISAFLQGDLRQTYWHFYPGVIISWLEALGMTGQYLLASLGGGPLPDFVDYIYSDPLSLLVANRLPFALLTALAAPALYLLARRLLPDRVALLGALFVAFDPFFLAHSRVAHGDGPVTVFMSLSALAFFVYLRQAAPAALPDGSLLSWRRQFKQILTNRYLIASAVLGGLAALTKAPGPFVALFITGLALFSALQASLRSRREDAARPSLGAIIGPWLLIIAAWGLISLAVFVLLWPAMWVDPLGTIGQMWAETFGKVSAGHLVYFQGQPTLDPGLWFYLYVIPFRLTPLILIGAALSLLLFLPNLPNLPTSQPSNPQPSNPPTSQPPTPQLSNLPTLNLPTPQLSNSPTSQPPNLPNPQPPNPPTLQPLTLLWLFTLSLLLFGNLSPKKQDRYLLPLFPLLNLLAALGWVGLFDLAAHFFLRPPSQSASKNGPHLLSRFSTPYSLLLTPYCLLLLLLHALPIFTYYPYYLTYFNPLLGGPARAAETTLVGWGEGMEQAAAYLNAKPNAAELYVASTPSQTLLPYFAGTGENFYTNDIAFRADYVVLYLPQMQRLAPSPEIVRYFQAQEPEKVIEIMGLPYAKIYPNTPRILPDIPPEATPVNLGLEDKIRLAGYHLPDPPVTGDELSLTLYWHALAPLEQNYTISVRALDAAGRRLAQRDSWPVDGLLPTRQWRPGDYVADTHTLALAPADRPNLAQIEVVVYNAETGQTLGPPLQLPGDDPPR